VFVCTLLIVVVAVGLLALATPAPGETEIAHGSGPFSTFPASWVDFCGYSVHGNQTTSIDLEDPQLANSSLSQIYSEVVDSSAFLAFANGSSWVTVGWSDFQLTNGSGIYHVLAGDFVFVSGGRPDRSAQVDYFLESGRVTSVFGPLQSTCVG
jgi:hypothetical protein